MLVEWQWHHARSNQSSHNIKYTWLKCYLNFKVRRRYLVFSRNPNSFSAGLNRFSLDISLWAVTCFSVLLLWLHFLASDVDASAKQGTSFSNLLHRSVETASNEP